MRQVWTGVERWRQVWTGEDRGHTYMWASFCFCMLVTRLVTESARFSRSENGRRPGLASVSFRWLRSATVSFG